MILKDSIYKYIFAVDSCIFVKTSDCYEDYNNANISINECEEVSNSIVDLLKLKGFAGSVYEIIDILAIITIG